MKSHFPVGKPDVYKLIRIHKFRFSLIFINIYVCLEQPFFYSFACYSSSKPESLNINSAGLCL